MSPSRIHPTAIIDPRAELAEGVEVGPCAVIEAGVRVGPGTVIGPFVHLQGLTEIGPDNRIGTGATLGHAPQHAAYRGVPTRLLIGRGNTIREYVSVHRAFEADGATLIGDGCMLMGFCHVAHDCRLGDRVTIANGSLLGGHVTVGDGVFISGLLAVHQFCRIGRLAMLSGLSGITQDVPPFMIVEGRPAFLRGLNTVGLRRAGVSPAARQELRRLFRQLYRSGRSPREAIAGIDRAALTDEGKELIDFYASSRRGVTPFAPYRSRSAATLPEEIEQ